jgi:26S proteasome regulatory subunit N7
MFAKARFMSKVGDWTDSIAAYDEIFKRTKLSTGKKIDAAMEKARISLFLMDFKQLKLLIAEAKKYIDSGGDWDRRNRLKVYEAIYLISARDLKQASALFIECVATFTCVELCSYQKFMFYAVLANIPNLSRVDLKKKLISNPHVISMLREIPKIATLLQSLYNCDYAAFFKALLVVYEDISEDRYLGPHATYIVREYRVLAYTQFLEAYRSVTLSSMANAFGISVTLLDSELSRFISAGRLNAKIDKVGDVIETSRPDQKNAQYQDVIKKGDSLLNRIQKLVRVVDV